MTATLVLISLLASPSWRTREAATAAIVASDDSLPVLLHFEHASPSAEGRRRITFLIDAYYRCNAERLAEQYAPLPWIHHVIPDHYCYVEGARRAGHSETAPNWTVWRIATRDWLVQQIRMRRCPDSLRLTLHLLRLEELRWRFRHHPGLMGMW